MRSYYSRRHLNFTDKIEAALWLLLALLFMASQPCGAQDQASAPGEIWAQWRIAGQPAGYYHEKTEARPNQESRTLIESDLIINRMGSKVELKSSSRYDEDSNGHLLRLHTEISSSQQSTQMDVTVNNGSLLVRTSTGGKTYERNVPVTGTLLGPQGIRRLQLAQLKSAGDSAEYQMFSPEMGSAVTVTDSALNSERLTILDKQYSALKINQTMSGIPSKTTVWLDRSGWLLRETVPSPFGEMETIRSDSAESARASAGAGSLPEESFTGTIVHSNVRLPEERLMESLKVRIVHKKPELGWPDFKSENQKVLEQTPNYVVLEIQRVEPKARVSRPVQPTSATEAFLSPNALLQSDDATVRSIAQQVAGQDRDLFQAARALQEWTNENMHFDLGIAIAPASEVVRDRKGTCFGYSMLLGSLARAAGIPSRIKMGFVYADGVWGGHAWVEVLVGDQWIPLDGALYSPGPADAARISFYTSALEGGTLGNAGSLSQMFGSVNIRVLEYTVHGKRTVVPEDARPFVVEGNSYRNSWLGISLEKPASFRFTKLDAAWPDTTVLAMEGPQHQVVEVESHSASLPSSPAEEGTALLRKLGIAGESSTVEINHHRAVLLASAEKAGVTFEDGGNVWVIKATGPNAPALLKQTISKMKLEGAK